MAVIDDKRGAAYLNRALEQLETEGKVQLFGG
jgi:hypothetical protein